MSILLDKKKQDECKIKIRDGIKKQVLPKHQGINEAPLEKKAYIETSHRTVKQSKNQNVFLTSCRKF